MLLSHVLVCMGKYCYHEEYQSRYFDGFTRFEPPLNARKRIRNAVSVPVSLCVYVCILACVYGWLGAS
jgi:hypothetical protein